MNSNSIKSCVKMAYSSYLSNNGLNKAPPLIILHGLLGSKANWRSLGKAICVKTKRNVYTVDARNHGDSPHLPQMDYPSLAEDLLFFLKEHKLEDATLMGHSMGGRTVMAAALLKPDLVKRIIVLDISPLGVSTTIDSLPKFVDVMAKMEVPSHLAMHEARKHADKLLQPFVLELGVRQFLLTNLIQENNKYKWRVNLAVIAESFVPHIVSFPINQFGNQYNGETTFIGGELSNYIKSEDHEEIKKIFTKADFHIIPGSGHWLHAEKPKEFLNLIISLIS